jgi:hypothetical protein
MTRPVSHLRVRLTLGLLLWAALPSWAAPPTHTTWLGYPIVAEPREGGSLPVLVVVRQFQVGIVPPAAQGAQMGTFDPRLYWRLTPNGGGTAPGQRQWLGPPEIATLYKGPPLTQYPWPLPLQSRIFQGVTLGLDPDGTVRWKYDSAESRAGLKLGNPHWLGLLRSGIASVDDPTSASQVVPWPSLELGLADTGELEGPVIWRPLFPQP